MSWQYIEESWRELTQRLMKWGSGLDPNRGNEPSDEELPDSVCRRYGIKRHECGKRFHEWAREPGALDDWNDRRSI
jgi:hypothetical protein